MSKIIILTQKIEEGTGLKRRLCEIDPAFNNVPQYTKEDLKDTRDCRFIFSTWYMPTFTENEIESKFPNLEAIFYAAGTVKQFAEPFLKKGVRVFSAARINGIPVAEFTVAQIILANKGYFKASRDFTWPILPKGYRKIRRDAERHKGNYYPSVGLLGCGSVGSKVVELLKPYCMKVTVYDPYLSPERAVELGVGLAGLETIFETCDVISNHLPDIPETKKLINKSLLQSMKPYATIINTGRGAQIDESALADVLRKRKDLTALLDVTSHEPPYPWSKLYSLKNIFFSPHLAGSSGSEIDRMTDFMHECYIKLLAGENPSGQVTLNDLKTKA